MIQTVTMDDGVTQCVQVAAKENEIEIRIHFHAPGVNLMGFEIRNLGEYVGGAGSMEHE